MTHATSIDAGPQLTISEYGPAVVEKETQINLSNGNEVVDELENDLFTRMTHGELLMRTKRHKHSRHHHQSCSKRKKHHGHCDRHHRKKDQRRQQPIIDHNKATTPDHSKPGHTNEPEQIPNRGRTDGPEQIPNRGRTAGPEQFPNRPSNDRGGGSWTNEETAIDEWSINRRKENRRKTQYSESQNS